MFYRLKSKRTTITKAEEKFSSKLPATMLQVIFATQILFCICNLIFGITVYSKYNTNRFSWSETVNKRGRHFRVVLKRKINSSSSVILSQFENPSRLDLFQNDMKTLNNQMV